MGLTFDASNASNQTSIEVVGFTDADWAGDIIEKKSTSGYLFQNAVVQSAGAVNVEK